ncbi:undecaprenyl-diphosphate phosphatase [Oleiharenicola lentus]|uniref:undecaprenyl-diphosphate phosphatase n=1 Tax=Oleiharenicola lentus TaxID=2508720 RepID=UPI003F67BDFE
MRFYKNNLVTAALLCLSFCAPALAQEKAQQPVAELSVGDAIVLGVVEGVTEFLPISSTGHLIIANRVLGLESEEQLTDKTGQPLWYKKPSEKNPEGRPLTLKLAADTYAVVIQVGAIAAVVVLYWSQLTAMLAGLFGRSSSGVRLLRNVLLAFAPVAFAGFFLSGLIDKYLFSVGSVIGSLVIGAFIMLWAEKWRRANSRVGSSQNEPADLTPQRALGIGLAQCLALWPGTSRSMITIVGGYLAGLNPAKAAEFSFLVGLPTLAGAAVYKGAKSGGAMIEVFGWTNVIVGAVVAAVSAVIAVKFLVHFISRNGLTLFAYYRLALAAVLTIFYLI